VSELSYYSSFAPHTLTMRFTRKGWMVFFKR